MRLLPASIVIAALAVAPVLTLARQGFEALPPVGPAPAGSLPLFERIAVAFSPPAGSTLAGNTEITEVVRGTRTTGSFTFVLLFVRDDGAFRVWGRGSLGAAGGGAGGKMTLANVRLDPFFTKGRRLDAALLMQYSSDPNGFSLRTRDTPRCMFFNCFGDRDDVIVWDRVHYRRLVTLDWRVE
jgi:hypothetical protein